MNFTDTITNLNVETSKEADRWVQGEKKIGLVSILGCMVHNFFRVFFVQSGWREGYPGFMRAVNGSLHPLMSYAKYWELIEQKRRNM